MTIMMLDPKEAKTLREELEENPPIRIIQDGRVLPVPGEICSGIKKILQGISGEGKLACEAVLFPQSLNIEKAAELTGTDANGIVKMMDSNELPWHHEGAGRTRKIWLADLIHVNKEDEKKRRKALNRLTGEAQKLGLY